MVYVAGLDFGTSGARVAVMTEQQALVATAKVAYGEVTSQGWAQCWLTALRQLLHEIPAAVRDELGAIAINGTSATVLLCDGAGQSLTEPLLYRDDRGQHQRETLAAIAPAGSPVVSATSGLVKLLYWQSHLPPECQQQARHFLHQADWLAYQLHGQLGLSDYHNALKTGYDLQRLAYPDWLLNLLQAQGVVHWLPQVHAPGSPMGYVSAAARDRYGLPRHCAVMAGTTDSIAAFLASGARSPGDAVTSLGSTLVIKLLSQTRVDDSRYGIYSHRLDNLWLVGGASNTGGAVLQKFFSAAELSALSAKIDGSVPSPLDYYPLTQPGERFPINDPNFAPRLTPQPNDAVALLHGLLEGIARIERLGYARLVELGATPPTQVMTAGGGAQNPAWTQIRQRLLLAPVAAAASTEAAVGTARLALQGLQRSSSHR